MSKSFDNLVKYSFEEYEKAAPNHGRCFHVSFILHGSRILTCGINNYNQQHLIHKFGAFEARYRYGYYHPGRHSEIEAIKKINKCIFKPDYTKYNLVNLRINRNGKLALSCPCANCMRIISEKYHFKRIYFTTDHEEFGQLKI
ncbi:MAG: hypothetical protein HC836_27795 [Richelia sp. RM2_1_2]|nr:hypothetical protein [Richelia sp. RM2_1_2]